MAVFPCPTKSLCVDPSTPFANLTAEAPDSEIFVAQNWGYGPSYPPLGSEFTETGCEATCQSFVSQEDADLCAARQNTECTSVIFPESDATVDVFGNPATRNRPRPIFKNTAQSATVFCPDGNPFVYTVPAGVFEAFSQAQADATAESFAQTQAPLFLLCLGDLGNPTVCAGTEYADSVTAFGNFLAKPPSGNVWEIVSGALPPGITISEFIFNTGLVVGNTIHFSGTCNAPGTYPFVLEVTDSVGDVMVKPYVITVAGITNADMLPEGMTGTAYSQTLESGGVTNPIYSLEGGALPDGLTLDSTGVIHGTPTGAGGTFDFTLGVTGAGTGVTCLADASIFIQGGLHFDNLSWIVPIFNVSPTGTATSVSAQNHSHATATEVGFFTQSSVLAAGTMNYAGPAAAGNIQLNVTVSNIFAGGETSLVVNMIQDGNVIATLSVTNPPNGAGIYNMPFMVLATAGSLLEVDFNCLAGTGNSGIATAAVNVTLTMTPA